MLPALFRLAPSLKKMGKPPAYIDPPAYEKPTPFGAHEADRLIRTAADDAEQRFDLWLHQEFLAFQRANPERTHDREAFTQYLERKYAEPAPVCRPQERQPTVENRQTVQAVQDMERLLGLSNPYQMASRSALTPFHSDTLSPVVVFPYRATSRRSFTPFHSDRLAPVPTLSHQGPQNRLASNPAGQAPVNPLLIATLRREAIARRDGSHLNDLMAQGLSQNELLRGASNNERLQIMGLLRRSQSHSGSR